MFIVSSGSGMRSNGVSGLIRARAPPAFVSFIHQPAKISSACLIDWKIAIVLFLNITVIFIECFMHNLSERYTYCTDY